MRNRGTRRSRKRNTFKLRTASVLPYTVPHVPLSRKLILYIEKPVVLEVRS
jgi:hypothetical protein